MQLSTDKIIAEKDGPVGRITINNPERRNAIALEMWESMEMAFDAFGADPAVRCVVISGAGGKAFASGADISQFDKNRQNADAAEQYAQVSMSARMKMIGFDKPLIAMIEGFCMGGGLGIALTADLRICSGNSQFGIPAAKLSIAYDATNLGNLIKLVGPSKAKEILFTGRRYSAQEALDMGLVNRVVAAGDLRGAVDEITDAIAENAPLSIRASKLTIDELTKPGPRDEDLIRELTRACFDSEDYKEGRNAFMEKRKPVFQGR